MTAGPETVPPTPDAVDGQGRKQGQWTEPDSHGGVMVGAYVDDARDGEWKHVAADGRIRSEGTYAHGELDGEWTWWRANGELMQRGAFKAGEKHGEWTRWSPKGDLLDRGTFDAGRKVGEWTVFNADGSVKKVTKHRAG